MAFALLSHVVADLTLGKPALPWLAASACVRDALAALKQLADDVNEISIWDCSATSPSSDPASPAPQALSSASCVDGSVCAVDHSVFGVFAHHHCLCIGKVCMQNIICYLASEKSLCNPSKALDAPVTVLLGDGTKSAVQHIDPDASLLEALNLIIVGVQNLVVPITGRATRYGRQFKSSLSQKIRTATTPAHILISKDHNGQEYCWLTQEDVLRFLLGSIGVFSPLPVMNIEALGLIKTDVRMVSVEQDAISALEMIKEECHDMCAVAVVDTIEGKPAATQLVGDISRLALQTCNETASLALATLSAGDFLVFVQDCQNPPEVLIDMIRTRVHEKLGWGKGNQDMQLLPFLEVEDADLLLQKLEMLEDSSSEDDESGAESPIGHHDLSHKWHSAHFRNSRKGFTVKNRSGPIFCNPKSSLVAVLMQALAHREHYVWVTKEDDTLLGIVTLLDILTVMLNHINVFN